MAPAVRAASGVLVIWSGNLEAVPVMSVLAKSRIALPPEAASRMTSVPAAAWVA